MTPAPPRRTIAADGAMRSFFLLISVIVSGIVAAVLVLTGVAIAAAASELEGAPPDYVGVVIALVGMAGFVVPLWLWDVYQTGRTQKH